MRNLAILEFDWNNMLGTLPTSLFNLSSLQSIGLASNKLPGELPKRLGFSILILTRSFLYGNNFSGSIPISIRNLTSLAIIDLRFNSFTRKVPEGFGRFPSLNDLNLSENYLVDHINFITNLINCRKLYTLQMTGNYFSGALPESMANLSTTLTWLELGESLVSWKIPAGITNLINLEYLVMHNNQLIRSLPHDFGKLLKLNGVDLKTNSLMGKIPSSLGDLSRLSKLYFNDKILEGSIPESIGNCQSLIYLNLSYNNFYENISSQLFGGSDNSLLQIILSRNQLEGPLPSEISMQTNLLALDVSNKKLSGVIPDGPSDCPALQSLLLDENSFQGDIPPSLRSLTSLVSVDVSGNHLSGQIPDYLSKFNLTYLDLSHNNFEGRVPTGFVEDLKSYIYPNVSKRKLYKGRKQV